MNYRELLAPELLRELESARKILGRVPDGHNDFKPQAKSYTLGELAGHLAEMPMFAQLALTSPDVDLGANGFVPLLMQSRQQVLAAFEAYAESLVACVGRTTDETFEQPCILLWDGQVVFQGTRYNAYRSLGMNHMVHHRSQLGVYLRLLGVAVPASPYGPSADEQ